jgi:hypothetical protein
MGFEEVNGVLSQTGRSNDGTDPNDFYFAQFQVDLLPKEEWKRKITLEELIEEMDRELSKYQGITYNYWQPIIDNVAEAAAGIKAANQRYRRYQRCRDFAECRATRNQRNLRPRAHGGVWRYDC